MENNGSNKNFSQTRLIVVLVSIIVILVFVIGIFIGARLGEKQPPNNNTSNKEVNKKEKSKPKGTKKEEKISVSDDVSGGIPRLSCFGTSFPFDEKDIYLDDLSDNIKLDMLIEFLKNTEYEEIDKEFKDNSVRKLREFTEEDVKKWFEDTSFLKALKNKLDIDLTDIILEDNKYYLVQTIGGCEGAAPEDEVFILINSKVEGTKLIRTYRYYSMILPKDTKEVTEGEYAYFTYDYYKDSNHKELIAKGLYKEEQLEPYYDKMNTYDVYYDISNGNMRFEKMIFNEK